MHLGEVAVKFLLRHFVDAADDVFIRLTECFANSLEIPWMQRCTNGVIIASTSTCHVVYALLHAPLH